MQPRLDVLLIYPIWVTAAGRGSLQRMLPPLGILSIAAQLEAKGYSVKVLDLHGAPLSPEDFEKYIRIYRPRHVGITVLSNHFIAAHHLAYLCKKNAPDCRVITGGVHAEAYPEDMLRNICIDAVGRGDGEELMSEFVSGKDYSEILGMSYRLESGTIIHNPSRSLNTNLDTYPFPAYHLIDLSKYFPATGTYRNFPAMNALMTRGCPGKCNFCNSAKTTLRGRSPKKMADLIQHLREAHRIRQISFYDDTFTAQPKHVRAFCLELIRRKLDVTFVCYVRGDMFTDDLAALMAEAGCHQVLIGIETGSFQLMKDLGKPIDKEKYHNVIRIARKYKIEVRGAFIFGHLNETKESLEETLRFAIDLDLDFFQPSILTPYPGTEIFKYAKMNNLLIHEDYSRYGQGEVILKLRNMSPEYLQHFYNRSFFRFYLRPRVLFRQIKRIRSLRHLLDIFLAFKVFVIEGLNRTRSNQLLQWLDFDMDLVNHPEVVSPKVPILTWEVREPQRRSIKLKKS